jgi:hypothetical protein
MIVYKKYEQNMYVGQIRTYNYSPRYFIIINVKSGYYDPKVSVRFMDNGETKTIYKSEVYYDTRVVL